MAGYIWGLLQLEVVCSLELNITLLIVLAQFICCRSTMSLCWVEGKSVGFGVKPSSASVCQSGVAFLGKSLGVSEPWFFQSQL